MFQKSISRSAVMCFTILALVFGSFLAIDASAPSLALAAGADSDPNNGVLSFLDEDDDGDEGEGHDEDGDESEGEDDDDDGDLANLGPAGSALRAGFIGLPILLVLGAAATGWVARKKKNL
jgi:hypothetical protein